MDRADRHEQIRGLWWEAVQLNRRSMDDACERRDDAACFRADVEANILAGIRDWLLVPPDLQRR